MSELNRRSFTKAASASLLGLTVTGTASADKPDNTDVHLLEVWPSFSIGDVENLEMFHSDSPTKYAIAPDEGRMEVRTVTEEEANAITTADRLTNFRGIRSGIDSIGGVTLDRLYLEDGTGELQNTYTIAVDGYEMPEFDVKAEGNPLAQLLSSDRVKEVSGEKGFHRVRLPSQEVEVKRKIVKDQKVEKEEIPEWKLSAVIERPTVNVEIDPYLTVAFHPNLDIVGVDG